jgi:hypothetical protein
VQNGARLDRQLFGGSPKDPGVRFRGSNLARNDNFGKKPVEPKPAEQGPQPFIPIRDHTQFMAARAQGLQRREDVVENAPRLRPGEMLVKRGEKGLAGGLFGQARERLVNQLHPAFAGVIEIFDLDPGFGESLIEVPGRNPGPAVPGRDVGINMADGRVRFDQRAADVEGDDARGGVRKKIRIQKSEPRRKLEDRTQQSEFVNTLVFESRICTDL